MYDNRTYEEKESVKLYELALKLIDENKLLRETLMIAKDMLNYVSGDCYKREITSEEVTTFYDNCKKLKI